MAADGSERHTAQVVGADGEMDGSALERFAAAAGLVQRGLSYAVVSIFGPQGSGKSTLLNHLFGTSFTEMDALKGRNQTTKGIWVAEAVGIEPFTLVMDLEGTDGRERGEDDTAFEKQSALFALAVSDIVMINLWCHDIGREQAANRPLLKTIFEVLMRLFSPRKTTLLVVIRDKTKTPVEYLAQALKEDIHEIWDSVPKPEVFKKAALSEFFNVEVTALSSYEENEELFKEQIMVATVRCEEIADEKLRCFMSDEGWLELEAAVTSGPVRSFGMKLSDIIDFYLLEYDMETMYFDEGVRTVKRQQLQSEIVNHTHPAFETMIEHLHCMVLSKFKNDLEQLLRSGERFAASARHCAQSSSVEFEAGWRDAVVKHADWDATNSRNKLQQSVEVHTACLRIAKLDELKATYEKKLLDALSGPAQSILETGERDSWASIRRLYRRETEHAILTFSDSLSEYELDQTTSVEMVLELREHARCTVVKKAREEAGNILIRMKGRFSTVFSHDKDLMPRTWTANEDIHAITREARLAALRLMSVMAAVRLDDKPDKIDRALMVSLLDGGPLCWKRSIEFTSDPLASTTWQEVSPKDTLITPVQCKSIWRQFKAETEYPVAQAILMQEAHRRSNNLLPPAWTILVLAILGFNEFMFLLSVRVVTGPFSHVGGLNNQGCSFVHEQEPCIYSGALSRFCSILCCMVAIRHLGLFPSRRCVWTYHYFVKSPPHYHGHRSGDRQHEPQEEAFLAPVSPSPAIPCSKLEQPVAATR
ncbi:protein ROOT HAIR DEFECTIVE 3 homolog 2 isoform X4 [Triticum aestivum]|uniref:protein ROOT HAIR DEFECTIVE 3 homolog 2 isoform X4 n=1 Tax=Triticum aestivum TaxID=4565 RepID=UPI001D00DC4D|nr:protein ROOT HAIR DEFECTIVE 3 homolog 2-like isoform X4 [Triticum aestivum]